MRQEPVVRIGAVDYSPTPIDWQGVLPWVVVAAAGVVGLVVAGIVAGVYSPWR